MSCASSNRTPIAWVGGKISGGSQASMILAERELELTVDGSSRSEGGSPKKDGRGLSLFDLGCRSSVIGDGNGRSIKGLLGEESRGVDGVLW
jgi:hypothetical protein